MTTTPRTAATLRRLFTTTLATGMILGSLSVMGSPAHAATLRDTIVSVATAEMNSSHTTESPAATNCNFYTGNLRFTSNGCASGYGISPWCADFAKYVWKNAGVTTGLSYLGGYADTFQAYGLAHGTWHSRQSGYIPQKGDAILFDWNHITEDHPLDHVGIVTGYSGGRVYTISGNNAADTVGTSDYDTSNVDIIGYASPAGAGSSSGSTSGRDFDGDLAADVLARVTGSQDLNLYQGNGIGGFQTGTGGTVGTNWSSFDLILSPGDFDSDGDADVLARNATTKALHLYRGNGDGGFQPGTGAAISSGWGGFDTIVGAGDFDGDTKPDLITRNATTKALHLYRGNGAGGFQAGTGNVIGSNWGGLDVIVGVGDFSGDTKPDLIGRNATTKALHLYHGNGAGGFQTGTGNVIGSNWGGLDLIASVGDFDGDTIPDLIARDATTLALRLYQGNGAGGFQTGTGSVIGTNWGGVDVIF